MAVPFLYLVFGQYYEAFSPHRATSINLNGSGTTGYFLVSDPSLFGYAPDEARADIAYSASPFRDGAIPVAHRYGNAFDTINLEIVGSSVDDAMLKLRDLQYALRRARDYFALPGWRDPAYLSFQPSGATSVSHSVVYDGQVTIGRQYNDTDMVSYRIQCSVKLEREPFWRSVIPAPLYNYIGAPALIKHPLAPPYLNAKPWGSYEWQRTIAPPTDPLLGGDMPLLARLMFSVDSAAGLTVDKAVFAVASHHRHPNQYSNGVYLNAFRGGAVEVEGGTIGTDTTATADATASPGGGGNTRMSTNFVTTAMTKRFTHDFGAVNPQGNYRVFARLKLSAAGSASVKLKYFQLIGASSIPSVTEETSAVTITATSWTMVDLGLVGFSRFAASNYIVGTVRGKDNVELWASKITGGAGLTLHVDFLFYMPVDECYLTISGANVTKENTFIHASTIEPAGETHPMSIVGYDTLTPGYALNAVGAVGSGALYIPEGEATFFWLTGDSSWQNVLSATDNHLLQIYGVERYSSPRGA